MEALHAEIDEPKAFIAQLTEQIIELTRLPPSSTPRSPRPPASKAEERRDNQDAQDAQTAVAQALTGLKGFLHQGR